MGDEEKHPVSGQWTHAQSEWSSSYMEGNRDNGIHGEEENFVYQGPQVEYEEVISPVYQIRTHTGKRPFVCHSCNTTVAPNSRHLNHIGILGGGGKPIVRHVYYMNFTRRSLSPVKGHPDKTKKRSKSKKTYHCDKCERIFGHKSHFVNHQRTHSGEKPFVCTHCGKTFGQKSNLTAHTRRHLGNGKLCNKKKSNEADYPRDDSEAKAPTTSSPSAAIEEKQHSSREKPRSREDVPETVSSIRIKSEPQSWVPETSSGQARKETVVQMDTENESTPGVPVIRLKIEKDS